MAKRRREPASGDRVAPAPLMSPAAKGNRPMFTSQAYTDRSNCRKAMKAHAEKTGTDLAFYTVRLVPGGRYVFEVPGPDAAPVNPTFVPPTAPEAEPPVKARRSKAKRID